MFNNCTRTTALKASLVVMGITSTAAQLIIIRELLVVFHGNELFIGIILGSWLIVEAAGSYLARRRTDRTTKYIGSFAALQIFVGLASILSILLIRSFKYYLDIPVGEVLGIHYVAVISLLVLAPVAMLDGALFPFGCRNLAVLSKNKKEVSARSYLYEALGSFTAGMAFVLYFIHYLNSIELAVIVLLCNLCSVVFYLTAVGKLKVVRNVAFGLLMLTTISCLLSGPKWLHEASSKLLWYEFSLLETRNSVYSNIAVIKEHGQYTFFANGVPYATTPMPAVHIEKLAHFPMLFHENPEQVLVIGGGAGGLLRELLKHPVKTIDYAEQDPLIIETFRRFPTPLTEYELNHHKVRYHALEGRLFLKKTATLYDLIITNLSIPSTLQLNRYYTLEFFNLVKKNLEDQGIFTLRLPGSETFLSTELKELNRTIHGSLKAVFPYVRIIIGEQNIFIASNDDSIKTSGEMVLTERLQSRGIQAELMSEWYIIYKLDFMRFGHFIKEIVASDQKILNTDVTPRGVFESLLFFNSIGSPFMVQILTVIDSIPDIYYFAAVIIMIAGFALTQEARLFLGFAVASTGFVTMLLNILLILLFQIYYGHVFHYIGMLTAVFMLGSAVGAFWAMKKVHTKIIFIETAIVFLLLFAYLFVLLAPEPNIWTQLIIFVLMAVSGLLAGMEYPVAVNLADSSSQAVSATAGKFYAIDLFGAFFGAIITAVIFIPMMGLLTTLLFAITIKTGSLFLIYKRG